MLAFFCMFDVGLMFPRDICVIASLVTNSHNFEVRQLLLLLLLLMLLLLLLSLGTFARYLYRIPGIAF